MISQSNINDLLKHDETRKTYAFFQSFSSSKIYQIFSAADLLNNDNSLNAIGIQLILWNSPFHPFEFCPSGEMQNPIMDFTHPPFEQFLDLMDLLEKSIPAYEDRSQISRVTKSQISKPLIASTIGKILSHSRLNEGIVISQYDSKNCVCISSLYHDGPSPYEKSFLKLLTGVGLIPTAFYHIVKRAEQTGLVSNDAALLTSSFYLWYETSVQAHVANEKTFRVPLTNSEKAVLRAASFFSHI